jgi:hypothetical protein
MLGAKPAEESGADLSLSEAKASAEDAAHAFADAVQAKDGKRIVRAFRALCTLCGHLDELEDAGESEDAEEEAEAEESGETEEP